MKVLLPLIILAATFSLCTPAPADHLHEYELSMLNQLRRSLFSPDKPSEYPRKGEYPCKGGICKAKGASDCEDCQQAKPLDIGEWEIVN